jgi:hypothetical protein
MAPIGQENYMITFKERTLLDSIKRLWPSIRRKQDAELKEAIRYLVKHPEAPCVIGSYFVANGYGHDIKPPWEL